MKISNLLFRVIQRLLPDCVGTEAGLGDYEELYAYCYESRGRAAANRWLMGQLAVILYHVVRHGIVFLIWDGWLMAKRIFLRQKFTSNRGTLHWTGLVGGLTLALLILTYAAYEESYDKDWSQASSLYRVVFDNEFTGQGEVATAMSMPAIGTELVNQFSQVIESCRLTRAFLENSSLRAPLGQPLANRKLFFATENFLSFWNMRLSQGDAKWALKGENKIVLTSQLASQLFGDKPALGREVIWRGAYGKEVLKVSGVLETLPENTHLKFAALISYATLGRIAPFGSAGHDMHHSWFWDYFYTYIRIESKADQARLTTSINEWMKSQREKSWQERNMRRKCYLQPVTDIHLYSNRQDEMEPLDMAVALDINSLKVMVLVLLLFLILNHFNHEVQNGIHSVGNITIRRILGASRSRLFWGRFCEELGLLTFISSAAVLLYHLVLPLFQNLTASSFGWNSGSFIPILFFFVLFMIASLIPFQSTVGLSISKSLNGYWRVSGHGKWFRHVTVFIQMLLTMTFLILMFTIADQVAWVKNMPRHYDMQNVIIMTGPATLDQDESYPLRLKQFRESLLELPGVTSFSCASNVPGEAIYIMQYARQAQLAPSYSKRMQIVVADSSYFSTLNLKFVAGQGWERPTADCKGVVLNEMACQALGFVSPEEAVGKRLVVHRDQAVVCGVLPNYLQMGPRRDLQPLMIRYGEIRREFFLLKYSGPFVELMAEIREQYQLAFPGQAFRSDTLTGFFHQQHRGDLHFVALIKVVSAVFLLITLLAIVGLASWQVSVRMHELHMRRALGACRGRLLAMISIPTIVSVVLAALASPVIARWLAEPWLDNFSVTRGMRMWPTAAGIIAIAIMAITPLVIWFYKVIRQSSLQVLNNT